MGRRRGKKAIYWVVLFEFNNETMSAIETINGMNIRK